MYPKPALTNNMDRYIFINLFFEGSFLKVKIELEKKLKTTANEKAKQLEIV